MFKGLSAFPLTPMDESGRVDTENFSEILERFCGVGLCSAGVLGSNGSYMFLPLEERQRVVAAAVETLRGKLSVVAGVGALRTDDAIKLAQGAAKAGADGLLLAPVSYTPLTEEEVFTHFQSVAEATDLPLCIYNNPTTTRFDFSPALITRLAQIPTITAVKMPLAQDLSAEVAALRAQLPNGFDIGYSGDWGVADAFQAGADGFYSGIAGVLPEQMMAMARAGQTNDVKEIAVWDDKFAPIWSLCKAHGTLRIVYAIAQVLQLTKAKLPAPLQSLPKEETAKVAKALENLVT